MARQVVGPCRVAPGLWRIELRIPLLASRLPIGLRVNVYVLEAPQGLYLVDCGPLDLYHQLRALLARAFPQKNVVGVYLTHSHFDHAGAGLRCVNEGVEVWAAAGDCDMLRDGGPVGVPQAFRYPGFQPTGLIDEGHTLALDGYHLDTVLTPGHTPGSACFHDGGSGILFCGDNLFGPVWGYGVTFLLELLTTLRQPKEEVRQQEESLGLLARRAGEGGSTLMLPGHGPPYHLNAHPTAFRRSARILSWARRLSRGRVASPRKGPH